MRLSDGSKVVLVKEKNSLNPRSEKGDVLSGFRVDVDEGEERAQGIRRERSDGNGGVAKKKRRML